VSNPKWEEAMRVTSIIVHSSRTLFIHLLLAFGMIAIPAVGVGGSEQARISSKQTPQTGTVRWFNPTKGYGAIVPDNGGDELYVHYTGIVSKQFNLEEGERVQFIINDHPTQGRQASNVEPIQDAKKKRNK
jgi:cold shock protein